MNIEQQYDALCEKLRNMHSEYKRTIAPLIIERDRIKPEAMAIKRERKEQEKIKLTYTEQAVYNGWQRGLRQADIARELKMSATNVGRVMRNLTLKLGVDFQ